MCSGALNCHTNDDRRAWFAVDLGVWLLPTAYTLRHARGYGRSALRSWQLQGSKDGLTWVVLSGNRGGTTSILRSRHCFGRLWKSEHFEL